MPARPDYEVEILAQKNSEVARIERMMREEGVHTRGREATILRPVTRSALAALAGCSNIFDFRRLADENAAYRDRELDRAVIRGIEKRLAMSPDE